MLTFFSLELVVVLFLVDDGVDDVSPFLFVYLVAEVLLLTGSICKFAKLNSLKNG